MRIGAASRRSTAARFAPGTQCPQMSTVTWMELCRSWSDTYAKDSPVLIMLTPPVGPSQTEPSFATTALPTAPARRDGAVHVVVRDQNPLRGVGDTEPRHRFARYMRSLSSPKMLDRASLWLQLADLRTEPVSQPLAHAIAEYLDAAYVELTIAAYGHGVEDGRIIGGSNRSR